MQKPIGVSKELLANTYQITWHHLPGDSALKIVNLGQPTMVQ
jgi:hypothetical protein